MATLPELTRLFQALASNLYQQSTTNLITSQAPAQQGAISSLVASFNSGFAASPPTPRVSTVDAALSLLCFTERHVFTARIECLARTIISVLNSLVSCDVSRFRVSSEDLDELLEISIVSFENLQRHGGLSELSLSLLHAAMRAVVSSSSHYQGAFQTPVKLNRRGAALAERKAAISKLTCFLHEGKFVDSLELPLRLLLWYLDPLVLKHEMSKLLDESLQRPFLSLRKELHDRLTWRMMIVYFVTSPTVFIEARAILHRWFISTGLDTILELQSAILSSLLDVLSRPIRWGVPMELGLKCPLSHVYFSTEQYRLLPLLTRHVSYRSFMDIVDCMMKAIASTTKCSEHTPSKCSELVSTPNSLAKAIDHNSTWGILMHFPAWFYFASALVFFQKQLGDSCLSKVISTMVKDETNAELQQAAMQYLTCVLSPIDDAIRNRLAEIVRNFILSWLMQCVNLSSSRQYSQTDTNCRNAVNHHRKLRIPKATGTQKPVTAVVGDGMFSGLFMCLKEFHSRLMELYRSTTITLEEPGEKAYHAANFQNSLLLRIPLGIMILYPKHLDERCCELLLHYATSGDIMHLEGIQKKPRDCRSNNNLFCARGDKLECALDGARLVFNLFDVIEDISSLFDCEDIKIDYITAIKNKVARYLLGCVKTLFGLTIAEPQNCDAWGLDTYLDLERRLTKWMKQGHEKFEYSTAFHTVLNDFARRSTINEAAL